MLVQYLDDGREPPQYKLLKASKVHDGIDPLYTQVMTDTQQLENFRHVIGSLMYLWESVTVADLSQLLQLDISNIQMALDHCNSILIIPDDDNEDIRLYCALLWDFPTSQGRSLVFLRAPAEFHARILIACLKAITDRFRG